MKPPFSPILPAALIIASLGFAAADASAATSYPMVCKAGASMNAVVRGTGMVSLNFNPATEGASVAPPSAGQCTWLDRPLRGGEPTRLRATNRDAGRYLVDSMLNGGVFYAHVYNDGAGNMIVTRIGP